MKKVILLMGLGGLLVFAGCKKEDTSPNNNGNTTLPKVNGTVLNNSIIQSAFSSMPSIASQAREGSLVYYKVGTVNVNYGENHNVDKEKTGCNVTITIDTVGNVDSLTVDWGAANCVCNDGKKRRGKIITTWTGNYTAQGTIITHTPVNYYVNDNKIEGKMTVENMGKTTQGQPYYNVQIDGVVTMNTGDVINYTSTRVRTFANGYTTPLYFMDDEYTLTGTAHATIQNGGGWDTKVTQSLHWKVGCPLFDKGIVDVTPVGLLTRTIDYGNGTCDGEVKVTIGNQTYTITIS